MNTIDLTYSSTIDITEHFSAQDWDAGNGPLSSAFLDHHGFEDVTTDERWFDRFEGDGHRLGCYERQGQYWIAYYQPGDQYELERIGELLELLDHLGIEPQRYTEDEIQFLVDHGTPSMPEGYNMFNYFDSEGRYLGPDEYGIEPILGWESLQEAKAELQSLHEELTAWNEGDLHKTAPSQLDDPDAMLTDAVIYEHGTYECSDEEAKRLSQQAIDEYCRRPSNAS